MPRSACTKRRARTAGTAVPEFALVGGLFLTLLIAGLDLARYGFALGALRTYAERASRDALVYVGNDPTNRCVTNLPNNTAATPGLNAAALTQAHASCATANGVLTITVTASYAFSFLLPALGTAQHTLAETRSRTL